jgi:drug/metabolite transporter (DMT)-like permease
MNKTIGHVLALITVTIWSSTFVITKLLLDHMSAGLLLLFRFTFAVLLLIIMSKLTNQKKQKSSFYTVIAGIALALYFIFENEAVFLTLSSSVGLFVALSPLFTIMFMSLFNKKSYFNLKNSIGILISFGGVFLLEIGLDDILIGSRVGNILAVIAGAMFSIYTVFLNKEENKQTLVTQTKNIFQYVLITILIYNLINIKNLTLSYNGLSMILGIAFLGIIASGIAFLIWNEAIKYLGPIKTNLYIYLIPLMTMIFGIIFAGETFAWIKLIGTIFILAGLYLAEQSSIDYEK